MKTNTTTRPFLLAALAAVAGLPLAAAAQGAPPAPPPVLGETAPPPAEPAPAGAADDGALGPLEGSASAADAGRGTVPPPDTYTIRPGDTLWDLSGRFLNNPWYWPKIWSYNPEIANPHWIYPGNVLKFYPAAEDAPARVEAAAPLAEGEVPAAEEEDVAAPVRELEDLSKANMKEAASAEERDAVAVAGPYKIGFVPSRSRHARHDTFVTPRELAESGALTAAFDEKLLLSIEDRAYARFAHRAEVKNGETYLIYKTLRPVRHPVSGQLFGYQSVILGAARVIAVDDRAVTVVVKQAYDTIERGAMLGPWTQRSYRAVNRRPNRQPLAGRIIASEVEQMTLLGEHHVVFVDKGQVDGVEEGNVFTVVRSGDLYGRDPHRPAWDERLPKEDVASLLVIDVRERASAALVTRSVSELLIGDRVEMRPDPGAQAGSGGN